jgi:hypothetical protein
LRISSTSEFSNRIDDAVQKVSYHSEHNINAINHGMNITFQIFAK